MKLTKGATLIIDKLIENGFEAYVVGGAVRDYYLGNFNSDVDITTSATPDEMIEVFKDFKTYPTGLKHGTVTINSLGEYIEVTTFRTEEGYSDCRRPDKVVFVKSILEDLKRRDFTVNAMAYNEVVGLVDPFLGLNDLKNKVIKAVGNPEERFKEDALRILRALRFSSKLNFEIDKDTELALYKTKHLLKKVSVERIYSELIKILMGDGVEKVLLKYKEIIFTIIPELKSCDNFLQQNKYHVYDVYTHIVKSISLAPKDKNARLALLLHDIGKPDCFSVDKEGVGHFYGHQKRSASIASNVLKRFKVDNITLKTVIDLVLLHDTKTELNRAEVKRFLNKYGVDFLNELIMVKNGDALAHNELYISSRLDSIKKLQDTSIDIINSKECYTLKDLKINGNDLKNCGYSGEQIKIKLNEILNKVIELKIENNRDILLKEIKND
ncbi:MAG: CCA tRNA nucleotidyltransferase [Clostridia bacterium]|nr:CCA tRNA nucleotidyltransferase [Clostridia bacterium]